MEGDELTQTLYKAHTELTDARRLQYWPIDSVVQYWPIDSVVKHVRVCVHASMNM